MKTSSTALPGGTGQCREGRGGVSMGKGWGQCRGRGTVTDPHQWQVQAIHKTNHSTPSSPSSLLYTNPLTKRKNQKWYSSYISHGMIKFQITLPSQDPVPPLDGPVEYGHHTPQAHVDHTEVGSILVCHVEGGAGSVHPDSGSWSCDLIVHVQYAEHH